MVKPIIFIKLGGSAITDKKIPYKVRAAVIRRLAREIKQADGKNNLIISHGAGSFAHTSAAKFGGKKGYKSRIGIATVSSDATRLNQIVTDIFVDEGLPAISLRPMSMIFAESGKLSKHFFCVLEEVLKQGLMPIVYGDVIWDKKWRSTIFSGEKIISEIAIYLKKNKYKILKVIQVGETNGVYDLDGKTISQINSGGISSLEKIFSENGNADVTGGMKHKVENAILLAQEGIDTVIINGLISNALIKTVNGKKVKGTLISSRKLVSDPLAIKGL